MKLEISHITKSYKNRIILDDISFHAVSGECIAILGENGSGKSTLLKILAGVQRPDRGSFMADGMELLGNSARSGGIIGYVPQESPLVEELDAYDNLRMWYEREDLTRELSDGFLRILGIDGFLKVPVSRMSLGMKKRLVIGCALYKRQPVLLMDEPGASLDMVCRENIYDFLRDYKASGGIVIIVTHEKSEIELSERAWIIKDHVLSEYTYDGDMKRLSGLL